MANAAVRNVNIRERQRESRNSYTPALLSLAVLYFMMGFITCLNDTLVPFFRKGFALNYTESSLTQFYFFVTYGLISFPASRVVERVGYKNGMIMGFSIAAVGALLFFPASVYHQYAVFLAALFVLAIGIVLLQVAANPYITILGPARTASSRLTIIQAVGSVGTTVAPLFGAYFILSRLQESESSSDAVRYPYIGIALLLLLIATIISRINLPAITAAAEEDGQSNGGAKGVFSFRNLNFGMWAIFFYVGAEVAIGTFLTNYIADTVHIAEGNANSYVALYWGSMLAGRLAGYFMLKIFRPPVVLVLCAFFALALIITSITSGGFTAVWTMIAVGLCNSIMFATIFSLAVNGLGKYTTRGSGILSTAIVGGAIIPLLQGVVKDSFSWSAAFLVPCVCYLYIIFYGLNGYKSKYNMNREQAL